jgi:competence protein ComEC
VRITPLPCAIALAAAIAVCGRPQPAARSGADDRAIDRIEGTVHAPVARGRGALVEAVWTSGHAGGARGPASAAGHGERLAAWAGGDVERAGVWVWTPERLEPGERIAVTGRLRTPRGFRDPGAPDRGDALAARGADLELTALSIEHLADDPDIIDRLWRWAADVQAAWVARIADPALAGIVAGDRGDVSPALDQRWRAVGIFHVLSVSGLHLAVVAGLLFALLRRLVAASPWGGRVRPARWAAPPALALAIAYTLITGGQLATVRALIAVALALIAQMLDRPLRLVDAIGAAAIAILLWRPADLYDPSFQLSFVAALTLAVMPAGGGRWIARAFRTSFWVGVTTAPLTAFHFHQVAAGGVIGNLVLTPIVELVALPLALAGVVLHVAPLVTVAGWLVARVDDLAGLFACVVPVGTVAIASPLVVLALVVLSLGVAMRPHRRVLFAGWLALCATWAIGRSLPPAGALRVTFLDVGQGDAAIVELPDGAVWLVDAGGIASTHDPATASAPGRAITRALEAYGHDHVDLAIISHPHPDHYLGLAGLGVPVGAIWAPDLGAGPPGAFEKLAPSATHPPLGLARREAGVELWVRAPEYEGREAADPVRTVNDNSLVVEIRFAGRALLFAGDVEAEGEEALVAAGVGHVDVVKVPHHGSPTSSTAAFVAATHPALAVISCGVANSFGFPAPEVVERWRAAGAEVARTDRDGAVAVTISPSGALAVDRFGR